MVCLSVVARKLERFGTWLTSFKLVGKGMVEFQGGNVRLSSSKGLINGVGGRLNCSYYKVLK